MKTLETTESIIPYLQEFDINNINQNPIPLSEEDITDLKTDTDISFKLVDSDGNTILLLEALTFSIYREEIERNIIGCFIKRFEYIIDILPWKSILEKCIKFFQSKVQCRTLQVDGESYLYKYKYLWANLDRELEYEIVKIIEFDEKIELPTDQNKIIHQKMMK